MAQRLVPYINIGAQRYCRLSRYSLIVEWIRKLSIDTAYDNLKVVSKSHLHLSRRSMMVPECSMLVWRDPQTSIISSQIGNKKEAGNSCDVSIVFELNSDEQKQQSSLVALRRPNNEPFSRTIKRLLLKISKIDSRNNLKLTKSHINGEIMITDIPVKAFLYGKEVFIENDATNESVFFSKMVDEICIGSHSFRVILNPPDCSKLDLILQPVVGFLLLPSYDLRPGCSEVVPTFHWYVGSATEDVPKPTLESCENSELRRFVLPGWQFRRCGPIFYPEVGDIGKAICILADFGPDSIVRCSLSNFLISNIDDEVFIFSERQSEYCGSFLTDGIRMMSYNILADLYLNLKLDQEDLFFPYCPKDYQRYSYRYPLLLRELLGYKADLIFLQEVDNRFFIRYLNTVMASSGCKALFNLKSGMVNEGLVICFRQSLFKEESIQSVWLTDLLDLKVNSENEDVVKFIEQDEEFRKKFTTRPTILQIAVLKYIRNFNGPRLLLCANTHLHFDPRHENIKVIQSLLCYRYIIKTAKELRRLCPSVPISIVFCGDFNSTPESGSCELIKTGHISGDHNCWNSNEFSLNAEFFANQDYEKMDETLTLRSLGGDCDITNYTLFQNKDGSNRGFSGCLDYMWGSSSIKVNKIIPLPSMELLTKYVALPSKISPSDHIPLLCEFEL